MRKNIILGIDFSNDYTQMAYMENDGNPVCVSIGTEDNYLIPTVVCYNKELDEWYVGDEACNKKNDKNCEVYEDILKNKFDNLTDVMKAYLSYLIRLAQKQCGGKSVKNVLITLEEVTPEIVNVLSEALFLLGYAQDEIKIISHSESFVYYVLSQNKDIWINQVYFLTMNKEQFTCRQLKVIRGRGPAVAYVNLDDLSGLLSLKDVEKNIERADAIVFNYLEEKFKHNVVSGVYISGEGFYKDGWKNTLELMCRNRRVFRGNNLIVKGAVYGAKEFFHIPLLSEYLISCKGRTRVKVAMEVKYKEREHSAVLSNVGDYWSQAKKTIECIMESPTKVQFEIDDLLNQKKETFEIDLTEFPKRPEKTTRIEVKFHYINEDSFEIVIKDLGFGELFESSGMEVKKVYHLK